MNKIDWERDPYALVLISLAKNQPVRQNQRNRPAIQYLLDLGWIERGSSSGVFISSPRGQENVTRLLQEKHPEWAQIADAMEKSGLSFNLQGLKEFREKKTQERAKTINLTGHVHHKTFTAITKGDSKSSLSAGISVRNDIEITHDDLIRIRPNAGLWISRAGKGMAAADIYELTGELNVTDRAIRSGFRFDPPWPARVLTVENLGFLVDLDAPPDTMIILVEGNNTRLGVACLALLPADIPVFHFGDYDQKGIEIFEAIAGNASQDVRFVIPTFLQEYLSRALPVKQPWRANIADDYPEHVIRELIHSRKRIEQEQLLADHRLKDLITNLPRKTQEEWGM